MKEERIEVEDGEEISAAFHDAGSDDWVFFCHGYGTDKKGSYETRAEAVNDIGFNAVRLTFRGNGESDGEFIEQDLSSRIDDLEAAVEHYGPENIYLFGMSFGGKVVLHAAEELDVQGIVFKSPVLLNSEMDKFRKVVEEKGSYTHFDDKTIDQRFFEDFDTYSFEETVGKLDMPVAIFQGGDDSTVKFERTAEAVKDMDTEVMVRKFDGETHFMTDEAEEKLIEEMNWWLERVRDEKILT